MPTECSSSRRDDSPLMMKRKGRETMGERRATPLLGLCAVLGLLLGSRPPSLAAQSVNVTTWAGWPSLAVTELTEAAPAFLPLESWGSRQCARVEKNRSWPTVLQWSFSSSTPAAHLLLSPPSGKAPGSRYDRGIAAR